MSDFDTFLVGSMGMEYSPLPKDQQEPRTSLERCLFRMTEMAWLGQVGCKLGMKSRHLFYKSALSVLFGWKLHLFPCMFCDMFGKWCIFARTWCVGVWTTRPTSSECHNVDPGLLDGWRPEPKGCEPEAFLWCWVVNVFAIYLSMCLLIHVFIY